MEKIEFIYPIIDDNGEVIQKKGYDFYRSIEHNEEELGPNDPNLSDYVFNALKLYMLRECTKKNAQINVEDIVRLNGMIESIKKNLYFASFKNNDNNNSINEECKNFYNEFKKVFGVLNR